MYRSMLYVPANSERFLVKAHERGADAVILDLEDSVPEADKDMARANLAASVARAGRTGAAVLVRINAGARAREDANAAANAHVAGVIVAKADPQSLLALTDLDIPLLALLEHPSAVLDARLCAELPNVIGLMVGGEDLATSLNAAATPEVLRTPKLLAHYAAKAEGKLSFGILRSIADYTDVEAIRISAEEARTHGFDGATCVHPSIVPILNQAFMPSLDEVAWATRVVEAARGVEGAFALDGKMVDRPVIERARAVLARTK